MKLDKSRNLSDNFLTAEINLNSQAGGERLTYGGGKQRDNSENENS